MNKILIAPSILSGDFASMGDSVRQTCEWGADLIHVDVMDGHFVPNITFGMPMVKAIKPHSTLPLDVHLMIMNPEKYVAEFAKCGADYITFHPNSTQNSGETLRIIHDNGAKAGIVINPDIDVEICREYIDRIEMILIMGVYPGFGGQKYIATTTAKIATARHIITLSGRDILLEVDGGVTENNIDEILTAGANVIVGGSCVYGSDQPSLTIKRLRGAI